MADDTTEADTTAAEDTSTIETDTTTASGDETSTSTGEDVSGLKSALASEREQRKQFEKELKALRVKADAAEQASMSDAEKAIAKARKDGAADTARTYGRRLASAELKAAAASKGVDLSAIGDLIDVAQFVDDAGEVDSDAIGKAVGKLAKITAAKPGRGSGEFDAGTGAGQPITEAQLAQMNPDQIAKAFADGKLKHLM